MGEQPRGFWAAAAIEPNRAAVIDPSGRVWSSGEVLADANRMVHALRARGLAEGDPVATLLPNRAEVVATLMAVVEPAPGHLASTTLADELLAHCQSVLAKYKCPRSIDFTDAMPRDPNGKLYKRQLRDPYWEGRERGN